MSPTQTTLTDAELIGQLEKSYIAPDQKTELLRLIPKMDDGDRTELMALIQRSHEEYKKAQKAYSEKLAGLEKEYADYLKKEESDFRKELERREKTANANEMNALSAEIQTIAPAQSSKLKAPGSNGHGLRNLILLLLVLAVAAGGILYSLN